MKRCEKQGKKMDKFKSIHEKLIAEISLPVKNKDHNLGGNWKNHRECHIDPDWLLIYRINRKEK